MDPTLYQTKSTDQYKWVSIPTQEFGEVPFLPMRENNVGARLVMVGVWLTWYL